MDDQQIQAVCPPNLGWLSYKLTKPEYNFVWECIDKKLGSFSNNLAGNIEGSYKLHDKDNWFFTNILKKLIKKYGEVFLDLGTKTPVRGKPKYNLESWWVNYQNKYDFNPTHCHKGVYSFAIWMVIPTDHEVENKDADNNNPVKSSFQFTYTDILGNLSFSNYNLSPQANATMLFFPSRLHHSVYPFFTSDGTRITVSGNVFYA